MPSAFAAQPPASILLLCGPSGAGKSHLASHLWTRYGWPVVQLDHFYREVSDPGLPLSSLGIPDWDHVSAWDDRAAVDALLTLRRRRSVQIPVYDIGTSRTTGSSIIEAAGARVLVAEGIFAAHLIEPLRSHGALAGAWCIRDLPWVTFSKRLVRDVRQRRKPVTTLWRRGHQLRRAEPGIVKAQERLGARAMTGREARRLAARWDMVDDPGEGTK